MPTYSKRNLPPCPGNPEDYQLARLDRKYYWRLKRGRRKPAVLNYSLQARADAMKALRVTIGELRLAMSLFMDPLPPGKLHQRLFGLLQGSWVAEKKVNYGALKGMELQPLWPFDRLFKSQYSTRETSGVIQLTIPATDHPVMPRNKFLTEFVLEAMLISGKDNNLQTSRGCMQIAFLNLYCQRMNPGCCC